VKTALADFGLKGCRSDFPLLSSHPELHYLDTAASAQKPSLVIDAISNFYSNDYANVHRGSYELSQRATTKYEESRKKIASFLGLSKEQCLIFTRGTTEAVNLVAQALAQSHQKTPLRSVLVTRAEHHANFVPWQQLAKTCGISFVISELDTALKELDLEHYRELLKKHQPSVVALSSSSNVLGNRHPWREMAKLAKAAGALVFLDLAQSVAHDSISLDEESGHVDFVAFSAHKIFGPTGIGVLWAKEEHLLGFEPTHFGGDMIHLVGDTSTSWNELPWKWEPGTPAIAQAVGFGAAIEYLTKKFSFSEIKEFETGLCAQALEGLSAVKGICIYGIPDATKRAPLVTFNLEGVHPLDLATWLDQRGLALRSGHHCTQPLHRKLGVESSIRASFSIYNDKPDVEALISGVNEAAEFFEKLRSRKKLKHEQR
jgi:cysteine desulfurase / selenocysteine lyase